VWDTLSGQTTQVLEGGHSDWIKGVAWSPFAPAALASVSDDGSVLLWDADKGVVKKKFEGGHSDFVTAVAFSPADPTVLATSSVDRTVVVWDIKGGGVTYKFTEASDEVHTISWSSHTEGLLATGSHDAKVIGGWSPSAWKMSYYQHFEGCLNHSLRLSLCPPLVLVQLSLSRFFNALLYASSTNVYLPPCLCVCAI
jgi:WD40 repeat protein